MAIPALWRDWPGLYGRLWAVTADAGDQAPEAAAASPAADAGAAADELLRGDTDHSG
ncbi:MAG TPA: hypothetical protein VF160_05370 [Candidatus Dormibacteraeota bacterium]